MVSATDPSVDRPSYTQYAAEEFDPDRFLDERVEKYLVKNSFIFLPFNAGPRICLGQQVRSFFTLPYLFWRDYCCQYAYNEMSFMLVRLMQSFSSISLELDSFPPGSLPPEEFKLAPGRKGIDKIWLKLALGLYIAVCVIIHTGLRTIHPKLSFRVDSGSRCRRLITHDAFGSVSATMTQQDKLRAGESEGKQERLNKTVTIFPFIYVNIRSKSSGIWSFQDNSMSLHGNDIIPR